MGTDAKLSVKQLDNGTGPGVNSFLAPIPFTMYLCAPKRSGKTTLLLNLFKDSNYLKGKFNRILFVSPTASMDPKVQSLKHTEGLLAKNMPLIKLIQKLQKREREILDDSSNSYPAVYLDSVSTTLDENDFVEKLSLPNLLAILEEQKYIIKNFGKEYSDKVLIVLDDSIKDKILKSSEFQDFIFKSRHYNVSVIFISQAFFALPKSLRLNNSQLLIWELNSKKEIRSLYDENGLGMEFKEFHKIYQDVISKPYSFLNINYFNDKAHRLIENFSSYIPFKK